MESNSIIHKRGMCYLCGRVETETERLEKHHCLHGTANRAQAEKYGLFVWLCHKHHRTSNESAHKNRMVDMFLIQEAQKAFEKKVGTRQEFMDIFGKNYL